MSSTGVFFPYPYKHPISPSTEELLAAIASCEQVLQRNCVKICFLSLGLNLLPVVLQCLLLLLESSSLVWTVNPLSFRGFLCPRAAAHGKN